MTRRAWMLRRYPKHGLRDGLCLEAVPDQVPGVGELLVQVVYVSVDPGQRTWIRKEGSYMAPLPLGTPMPGSVMGRVLVSRDDAFQPGDVVTGMGQWADRCVVPAGGMRRVFLAAGIDPLAHMSVLGATGWTAYVGVVKIGRPKAGETVVVSAAAGAVGSVAGQIAGNLGCRVIGIAGSDYKCDWLGNTLGFDAAVNYRNRDWGEQLEALCPDGIDFYFENVGGTIGQVVYPLMALGGRIALCGLVSSYEADVCTPLDLSEVLMKRVRVEGFNVTDYLHQASEMTGTLGRWLADGRLRYHVETIDGLEQCADALASLLRPGSSHRGKLLVRVTPGDLAVHDDRPNV